ncbi:hypothetical protein LJC46_04025 [Desulfovibrio sp. OttesenSCG-928-G15]|nr:hypothetical protein [Desulfovibrio sp. OttesenSCG-928-G15]
MSRKQLLVDSVLVCILILAGLFCYRGGKSYDILLENLPFELNAEKHPALEAAYAYVDNGKQIFMLDGDRTMASGLGMKHVLKIELLDPEDKVIETREIPFSIEDLGDKPSLNVAKAFLEAGAKE